MTPAWQRNPATQILCALAVIGPYYGLAIASSLAAGQDASLLVPELRDLLLQSLLMPLIFGGLALLLHRYVCGEALSTLQPGRGGILTDIAMGIGLYSLLMLFIMALGFALNFGKSEPMLPEAVRGLADAAIADPRYMAVLFGPVFWLQAALLEEVTRAYLLLRLWRVWNQPASRFICLLLSSLAFGCAHIYEGWQGVLGTALIGLVLGSAYLFYGRLLPLIIAHGLYNTTVLLITIAYLKYLQPSMQ